MVRTYQIFIVAPSCFTHRSIGEVVTIHYYLDIPSAGFGLMWWLILLQVLGDVKRLGAAINRLARAGMHDHLDFHNSVSMAASSSGTHSSQHLKHHTLSTLSASSHHTRSRSVQRSPVFLGSFYP